MFITNNDKSYIAYKDLINNSILLFNMEGILISSGIPIKSNNWQIINLFEVPVNVLQQVTNTTNN